MGGKKKRPKNPDDDKVDPKSGFSRSELYEESVDGLKGLLRFRGLPVSGSKAVLIDRLMNSGDAKPSVKKLKIKPAPEPKTSATEKKTLTAAGLTESQINDTDFKYLKAILTADAKSLAGMVDRDWHDGYEEQEEQLIDSLVRWNAPMNTVVALADNEAIRANPKAAHVYERCHETLRALADAWNKMNSVSARSCPEDVLSTTDHVFEIGDQKYEQPAAVLTICWSKLLTACASARSAADKPYAVEDATMHRYIKDAVDCGVDVKTQFAVGDENKDPAKPAGAAAESHGLIRLRKLIADPQWTQLPTTMKAYKKKRAIDRRFFGPKSRRTRDFDDDEWL